jgi:hypothetical protein
LAVAHTCIAARARAREYAEFAHRWPDVVGGQR